MVAAARARLRGEWQHLTRIEPSDRPWQMPVAAALATGLAGGLCLHRPGFRRVLGPPLRRLLRG
jgi:hypothetical protein